MNKRAFDRTEDLESCINSEAYEKDEVFALDDSWDRACAPPSDYITTACIFWHKDSCLDITPTWAKVVRLVIP